MYYFFKQFFSLGLPSFLMQMYLKGYHIVSVIFYVFYPIAPSKIWLVSTATKQQQKRRAVSRCLKSGRQRFESLQLFFIALWIPRDFLSLCLLPYGCSLRPRNSKEMGGPSRFQNSSSPIKLQPWNLEQRNTEAIGQAH